MSSLRWPDWTAGIAAEARTCSGCTREIPRGSMTYHHSTTGRRGLCVRCATAAATEMAAHQGEPVRGGAA